MKRSYEDIATFADYACSVGEYSVPSRFVHYVCNQLFQSIDVVDKSIVDIGGGSGVFSLAALTLGASKVTVVEPESDGSESAKGSAARFMLLSGQLSGNASFFPGTLSEYVTHLRSDGNLHSADIIILHNTINHIDEGSVVSLDESKSARENYIICLSDLALIARHKSTLIVSDCAPSNFFRTCGLSNPFMPTIEWDKHQPPNVWSSIFKEIGWNVTQLTWTYPNSLSWAHRLLRNKWAAYMLLSHFRMVMTRDK